MKLTFNYEKKDKQRIDKYLAEKNDENLLSRSFIDRLIQQNLVTVNNKICKKNTKLQFGDVIRIEIPPKREFSLKPLEIPIKVVYEDENLIIVDKPAGLTVHPAPGHYDDTLVNALVYHFKNLSSGSDKYRPGIVHRLDKNTSGLIIVAKDDKTHLLLSEMFQKKKIKKRYVAITVNSPAQDEGTIKTFHNRDKRDRKKFAVANSGKQAITHYKAIKRYDFFSVVQLLLETGRTHQIRVHLNHINCPILGDDVYSSVKKTLSYIPEKFHKKVKGLLKNHLTRQALHSAELEFLHPISGKKISVKSDLPDDMKYVIKWLDENFSI